jgi:DNA mismatch repair ATPase MutS
MSFVTDQQTLDDLNIPGKYRPGSVFSLFNRVVTVGGERRLEAIFRQPLTDYIEINQRAETMKYFMDHPLQFPFTKEDFRVAEEYLEAGSGNTRLGMAARLFWKKITSSFLLDKEYKTLHDQLLVTIRLLDRLATFRKTIFSGD